MTAQYYSHFYRVDTNFYEEISLVLTDFRKCFLHTMPKMKMKYLSKPFLFNFRSFFQRMKINMKYNVNPNPDKYVCKAFAIFIKLNDICSAANKGF